MRETFAVLGMYLLCNPNSNTQLHYLEQRQRRGAVCIKLLEAGSEKNVDHFSLNSVTFSDVQKPATPATKLYFHKSLPYCKLSRLKASK